MILIDYKKGGTSLDPPKLMVGHLKQMGIPTELSDLQYADAAFEGRGPEGTIAIGVERKTLHDLLNCIDDGRLSGHQLIGMKNMYDIRVVIVEGHWKPHEPQGILMEGFNGGTSWGYCRYRSQRTLYSKVYRYLISLSLSGAIVTYSRDLWHTSYNVHEWFHYFQKKWDDHTSMKELHKIAVPSLSFKPSLVRKWAQDLTDIGTKKGDLAARHFRKPITLAQADESEWLKIPGVGVKTAQSIVREIWGNR